MKNAGATIAHTIWNFLKDSFKSTCFFTTFKINAIAKQIINNRMKIVPKKFNILTALSGIMIPPFFILSLRNYILKHQKPTLYYC